MQEWKKLKRHIYPQFKKEGDLLNGAQSTTFESRSLFKECKHLIRVFPGWLYLEGFWAKVNKHYLQILK